MLSSESEPSSKGCVRALLPSIRPVIYAAALNSYCSALMTSQRQRQFCPHGLQFSFQLRAERRSKHGCLVFEWQVVIAKWHCLLLASSTMLRCREVLRQNVVVKKGISITLSPKGNLQKRHQTKSSLAIWHCVKNPISQKRNLQKRHRKNRIYKYAILKRKFNTKYHQKNDIMQKRDDAKTAFTIMSLLWHHFV